MQADFHIHSSFSGDSDTPMRTMIERGISLGLKTMCFTEHFDADFPNGSEQFSLDTASYYNELRLLQEEYAPKIEVLFGVELGMQAHLGSFYADYVRQFPFDFVIASQHIADHMDPYYPAYWNMHSVHDGIALYFQEMYDSIRAMKDYDTLGHLDYIVRYAKQFGSDYSYAEYSDLIDPILKYIISQDKCLEVNTAGFKAGLGHPNPAPEILARYRELGGEHITVGADGHRPEHLAYHFDLIDEYLKKLGFRHYCTFRQRKRAHISL
ncbi:MAG: histidinol-phosphatase HisJ family protein [Eubacteriales bacterium]|nr:histidinol-phosphatase HisJ family protein [Eubacteriales bacterium]